MKVHNVLYPYDSSDDEGEPISLEVIRNNVKKLDKIPSRKSSINSKSINPNFPIISSYLLMQISQSFFKHEKAKKIYEQKKIDLSQQFKFGESTNPELIFYKFIPSLILYNKSGQINYSTSVFKSFYMKFTEEIHNFINIKYLQEAIDFKKINLLRAQYKKLITESASDLYDYHNSKTMTDKIKAIKEILPTLDSKIKNIFVKSKKGPTDLNIKPPIDKATIFLESTIDSLTPDKFFSFLESAIKFNHAVFTQISPATLKLIANIIRENHIDLFLVKDILIANFNLDEYIKINYPINIELRSHLSTQTFTEDFSQHMANLMLDHKIIRHLQKITGARGISDTLQQTTKFSTEAYIYSTIKISANGSRTDYREMPTKHGKSNYTALLQGKEENGTGELEEIKYSSDIIKKVLRGEGVENGVWKNGFIYRLTDLLFNCETQRGVSAYLTNAMFFELVDAGIYKSNELSARLPIAIKAAKGLETSGAVDAYRYLYDLLGGTYGGKADILTTRNYYDHKAGDKNKAIELMARDTILFIDWLLHKKLLDGQKNINYKNAKGDDVTSNLANASQKAFESLKALEGASQETLKHYAKPNGDSFKKVFKDKSLEMVQSNVTELENILQEINNYLRNFLIVDGESNIKARKLFFKELHNLIYEWYGVHLDYLYSTEQFELDLLAKKINKLAIEGKWEEKHNITNSCKDLFSKDYLKKNLKQLNGISDQKAKINDIKKFLFKNMCQAIIENPAKNMKCIQEFAKKYPELVKDIAKNHPNYFINQEIANLAINDANIKLSDTEKAQIKQAFETQNPTNPVGSGLKSYEDASYWYEYSKVGIEEMLALRIKSTGINNTQIIRPEYIFDDHNNLMFANDIVSQMIDIHINLGIDTKILIPINLYNKHWVGMVIETISDYTLSCKYIDSEGNPIPSSLENSIKQGLQMSYRNADITMAQVTVELQKYNNCGPELIENLIAYISGEERIAQEQVIGLHSVLYEVSLIKPEANHFYDGYGDEY